MPGETSDNSQFCELECFKCVMFQDESAPFPDDVLKLGHYLGPNIDVSPVMTTEILTENGQVLHRSTYRPLTLDEIADKDKIDAQEEFMVRVNERLESHVQPRELEGIGLKNTPQCDVYENETPNKCHFPSKHTRAHTRGGSTLYRCRDTAA